MRNYGTYILFAVDVFHTCFYPVFMVDAQH